MLDCVLNVQFHNVCGGYLRTEPEGGGDDLVCQQANRQRDGQIQFVVQVVRDAMPRY